MDIGWVGEGAEVSQLEHKVDDFFASNWGDSYAPKGGGMTTEDALQSQIMLNFV